VASVEEQGNKGGQMIAPVFSMLITSAPRDFVFSKAFTFYMGISSKRVPEEEILSFKWNYT
jgi:hypothetical protein